MTEAFDPEEASRLLRGVMARQGTLVQVLQALQGRWRWLSPEALTWAAKAMGRPQTEVLGVATFYNQFRLKPLGRHMVRVCRGTACHIKGAPDVFTAFRERLALAPGADTDTRGDFTVEEVSCLGTCTLAPVVQVDDLTCGHVTPESVREILERAESRALPAMRRVAVVTREDLGEIRVGSGSCCVTGGADAVRGALEATAGRLGVPVRVAGVSCVGICHQTPLVEIRPPMGEPRIYTRVMPEEVPAIVERHFPSPNPVTRALQGLARWVDGWDGPETAKEPSSWDEASVQAFLKPQVRITTEDGGDGDPLDLGAYKNRGGFLALATAREKGPAHVLQAVEASGLRGRGGAGFPTGRKWNLVAAEGGPDKTIVVNGDEGDPGAFMDRMILESHPFRVLEGVLIGALAVGAREAIFYIREEYPLALSRIRDALEILSAHEGGALLGGLQIRIVPGAGAFVCGEETALLASLEGRRGMPVPRPPFPASRGYLGRPTLINNVETWASIPWILRHGAEAFHGHGIGLSRGTKVFSLTGKTVRGGLIEVPMGMPLRTLVESIGGGVAKGRTLKAVQIGGPSGACLPASALDAPVDYESLKDLGAIMGSGGLVVMDDEDCMVDMARYFMTFTARESCGRCTFCRVGTVRLLEILTALCEGKGRAADLAELETLARGVTRTSLCGLGRTAPNPVLSILRHFRSEVEAHVAGVCPAGTCKDLRRYSVLPNCTGCTRCLQACPVGAVSGAPYERHRIDQNQCTRCDACRLACPDGAINRVGVGG